MRKVSRILLLVGGILAIVTAVSLLITAIVLFVSGSPLLTQFLEPILRENGIDDPEKITLTIQIASVTMGVFFVFMALCGVPAAIVNFLGSSKHRSLPNLALLQFAVTMKCIDDTFITIEFLCKSMTYRHRQALSK